MMCMIADIPSDKKLKTKVTEFYIGGRKLNISLVFITKSYFAVPKNLTIDDQGRKQVESLKVLKPVNINKNKSKLNKFSQKI